MRKILALTLLLLAGVTAAGATYTVAHSGHDHAHRPAAGDRAGSGAGHIQAQPAKIQSGHGQAESALHRGRLTLASNQVERSSLPDVSDGYRHDHDRLDDQAPRDDYGLNDGGRETGSAATDASRSGESDDSGWGNRFASFGSPAQGPGGFGGLSGPSRDTKPGQGSDPAPSVADPVGDQGDHKGAPPKIFAFDNGDPQAMDPIPQTISKNLAIGPVAGVPEPSTWMMMLVGVGALGAALRRMRHRETARPAGVVGL